MNIFELESFDLADAVKFHDRLNHRLWDRSEHLHPQVRDRLMAVARDFQEFLGVPDLDVKDITVSGSNAAYNYTDNSDIDLHLVVEIPQVEHDEVYRELFNAKKYQYNDQHNIRIGGADVELYAQPSDQPHHSQGIYSLLRNAWIQVPRRRRVTLDDSCVQAKYQDLLARIEDAVASGDSDRMRSLQKKIKAMRQTGLEQQGEFGCDNLVFKMLRAHGAIQKLIDARNRAHAQELSLAEKAPRPAPVIYGFMTESPDGVDPSTKMFLEDEPTDVEQTVRDFIDHTAQELGITDMPHIVLHDDPEWSTQEQSFGRYTPETHTLEVNLHGRHIMDILRTTAHELTHCRQNQDSMLPSDAGETGSQWENQAHAVAGVIMRDYADQNPQMFESSGYIPTEAERHDPRFEMALSVDVQPGATGLNANRMSLKTDAQGRPQMLRADGRVNMVEHADWESALNQLLNENWGVNDSDINEVNDPGHLTVPDELLMQFLDRGWQIAGEGRDQVALTKPGTRYVLKIVGQGSGQRIDQIRRYVSFYRQHQRNPHFPRVGGDRTLRWEGQEYYAYTQELLRNLPGDEAVLDYLEYAMNEMSHGQEPRFDRIPPGLSAEQIEGLMYAVDELFGAGVGDEHQFDLSNVYNIMQRDNGQLVIVDPFAGWDEDNELSEGFKSRLAQAALAGGMALGAGGANAMDWKDAAMTGAMFVPGIGQAVKAYNVGKSLYQAGTAAKQYRDAGKDLDALVAQQKAQPRQATTVAYDPNNADKFEPVDENFADGRNPQDRGDSKRYGVPTKASVSTLRKVAKQGGRKGQLAHWMANMKAGRAKARRKNESLEEVRINNASGLGAVPNNADVDYFGLQVQMRPSMFLKLALPMDAHDPEERKAIDFLKGELTQRGIGAPFLTIAVPEAWEQGDFSQEAKVKSHDGRHRCYAVLEKEGDDPIEMHIFISHTRRRNITDEMIENLRNGILNQLGQFVRGPIFGEAK